MYKSPCSVKVSLTVAKLAGVILHSQRSCILLHQKIIEGKSLFKFLIQLLIPIVSKVLRLHYCAFRIVANSLKLVYLINYPTNSNAISSSELIKIPSVYARIRRNT